MCVHCINCVGLIENTCINKIKQLLTIIQRERERGNIFIVIHAQIWEWRSGSRIPPSLENTNFLNLLKKCFSGSVHLSNTCTDSLSLSLYLPADISLNVCNKAWWLKPAYYTKQRLDLVSLVLWTDITVNGPPL